MKHVADKMEIQHAGEFTVGLAMEKAEGMNHYVLNCILPADGVYTIKVHIDPPTFMRHDKRNGQRYQQPLMQHSPM